MEHGLASREKTTLHFFQRADQFLRCPCFFNPTGALKSYLRELPDPLMTTELYDEWIQASKWVAVLLRVFSQIVPLAVIKNKNQFSVLVQGP